VATHHNSVVEPVTVGARQGILEQLEDILRSVPFRTSRQCQELFRYVVEHSLAGMEDSLRERVIGIEVFGRAPNYDTADDPIVRLRAADIRKRLAQYYQAQNAPGKWKIDIPTGSYKAQFHRSELALSQVAAAAEPVRPESVGSSQDASVGGTVPRQRKTVWAALVLLAGLVVAAATGLISGHISAHSSSALDLFWEPVVANSRPVLVCTGSNRVYRLSVEARDRYRKRHARQPDDTPSLEVLVPRAELKNFAGEDFIPVQDTYLTIGDASATSQISSFLTSRRHAFDLRFGSDLSFGDLRQGSAVLIGAFNNSWTLNMTDSLRFVFDAGDSPQMHVQDRFDRSRSWWPKFFNGKFTEDYAIVSRILDSKTGSVLVTIAGLDHTGTRAAGDFATNPQMIAEFAKHAPKGWSQKNLQIVLHSNVVNDIPGLPTIVAVHYW
jgi:hypothetical protein